MGAINSDGIEFLGELGIRITRITDNKHESAFLFQRLSVAIQRYNAVAIQGTFAHYGDRGTCTFERWGGQGDKKIWKHTQEQQF